MFDEKELAAAAPTLTLNPITDQPSEKPQLPSVEEISKEMPTIQEEMDKSGLNESEKKQVEDFAKQIDIRNSTVILQYGAGTQQKMAGFSEKALENVKSKDLGEVGDMLTDVVKELKGFDKEEEKGFFGLFKKAGSRLETLKLRYDKAEVNVNRIVTSLENHQVTLLKDISTLDQMYGMNLSYYKELTMYILAGKMKLKELKETELKDLQDKAQQSGLPEDAQAVNDLNAQIDRFEKKIHDLELTRMVSIQTAPQIRLIQNNDTVMAEKIQSTIVNTIPLWKSQMVLALGIEHSNQAAKAQQQVTDMTNELLKKNAETLKMATVKTAQISERGIIDIETLRQTNESLISTLDEVQAIQKEGRVKRAEAEAELQRLESDLKTRLLELSKNK